MRYQHKTNIMKRSEFLKSSLLTGSAFLLPSVKSVAQQGQERPPPLKIEIVKEFVTVAHRYPMLSLGNTYSSEELEDFDGRV